MSENNDPKRELSLAEKRELLAKMLRNRAMQEKQSFEASPTQQALCFMQALDPTSSIYHLQSCLRIKTTAYPDFYRETFQQIVNRHAMLRSVFKISEEKSLVIRGAMGAPFQHIDASGWTDQQMMDEVHRHFNEPFDLENGPLIRFQLFTRSADDHVLLILVHHLICDGWSLAMIRKEFRETCRAAKNQLPPPVFPTPSVEFWDYVWKYQALLSGPEGKALEAYWKDQFKNPVPRLNLRPDVIRPLKRHWILGESNFVLDNELYEKLAVLAKTRGVTLFTVVLGAYQAMLAHFSNQREFLISFPVAGRSLGVEFESVVGHFVNILILRLNLAADPTFSEIIARTWTQVCGAMAHQEYPYCRLARFFRSENRDPLEPLTQVMINYLKVKQDDEIVDLNIEEASTVSDWGNDLSPFPLKSVGEHYDLALRFMDNGKKLYGRLQYATDLFDENDARDFGSSFLNLLQQGVEQPEQRLSQLLKTSIVQSTRKQPRQNGIFSVWWNKLIRWTGIDSHG